MMKIKRGELTHLKLLRFYNKCWGGYSKLPISTFFNAKKLSMNEYRDTIKVSNSNHKEVHHMLNTYYTENLLELKDADILNVLNFKDCKIVEIKMKQRIHKCPKCGNETSRVHDYRIQDVKDIPVLGLKLILRIHKRRHVCKVCGKKFFETVPFLPKYQRTTNRLWLYVLNELSDTRSMKSIAKTTNLSIASVARILDNVSYGISTLPEVLSIDEFKGNAGRKFQCILTDCKHRKVLDILPERSVDALSGYFSAFSDRSNVKYVVMDMSSIFRSMAENCFPKAKIIADKYHVYRQVQWAFEDVRKQVQKNFAASRRKYFKRSRTLLLKGKEKLTPDELEQISIMLSLSKPLAEAYYLLHEFREFTKATNRVEAKKLLSAWFMKVGSTDLTRFHKCVNTFAAWQDEILNAFDTGLTNGFTEGCNNKIKVIKRNAYGMRNFHRFRKRILHTMNR